MHNFSSTLGRRKNQPFKCKPQSLIPLLVLSLLGVLYQSDQLCHPRARRQRAEVPGRGPALQREVDRSPGGEGGPGGQDVPGRPAGAEDGHQGEWRTQAEGQHTDCGGRTEDQRREDRSKLQC